MMSASRPASIKYSPTAAPAKGREIRRPPGARRAGVHHNRVRHRARLFKLRHQPRGLALLLADGNIDADGAGFYRLPLLVEGGGGSDGRFAGVPIADDKLALAAADGDHRVDGFDARVERLVDRLAVHHAVGLALNCIPFYGCNRPEPV